MTIEEPNQKDIATSSGEPIDGEERWVDVKGYEGLYQVSTHGRVYSVPRPHAKGGILRPGMASSGYLQVHLYKNGTGKWRMVHRLVAENLIDNPDNLPEVNHKDECKTNNHISNLEWCTTSYNLSYGTGPMRRVASHDYAASSIKSAANHDYEAIGKKRRKPVIQYDLNGNFIKRWDGVELAGEGVGHCPSNISSVCRGKLPHAYGYIWRYEEAVNA